jgi:hypothetical protein
MEYAYRIKLPDGYLTKKDSIGRPLSDIFNPDRLRKAETGVLG